MMKKLKIPALILLIGIVVAIIVCLCANIAKKPTITEHDFNYSATYKLDGETKTVEGVYRVKFNSVGEGIAPLERYYQGEHLNPQNEYHPGSYTIAQKDDLELRIVFIFTDDYLMGDKQDAFFEEAIDEPYLAVYDKEEFEYSDEETMAKFDAELLSWELPQPIENSFVFNGFSAIHDLSMLLMLLVGILVIIACMIFVKRDKTIPYNALDIISIVFNFLVVFIAIPFTTLIAWLSQIFSSGDEILYQLLLCIPPISAFAVAASIALRRKGYRKSSFFIQFLGPVLFILELVLESFSIYF